MRPNQDLRNVSQPDLFLRIRQIEIDFAANELEEASAYVDPDIEDDGDALGEWEAAGIVERLQRRAAW